MISRTKNVRLGIADSSQLEKKNYLACMPYELLSVFNDMRQNIQDYCKKIHADYDCSYIPE